MARRPSVKKPAFLVRLKNAIKEDLEQVGLKTTTIELDAIEGTRLYRIRIIAPKFAKLGHFERQNLVWNLVKKELAPDQYIHVSTILTLTPSEADDGPFALPAA